MSGVESIAIDVDGVLCDFTGGVIDYLEEEYGVEGYTHDDFLEWNTPIPEIDRGSSEIFEEVHHDPDRIFNLTPYNGAKSVLSRLKDDGYEMTYATARPQYVESATRDWLDEHMVADIPLKCGCDHGKLEVDADTLIDDGEHNIRAFYKGRKLGLSLFVHRPWNANSPLHDTGTRRIATVGRDRDPWEEIARVYRV